MIPFERDASEEAENVYLLNTPKHIVENHFPPLAHNTSDSTASPLFSRGTRPERAPFSLPGRHLDIPRNSTLLTSSRPRLSPAVTSDRFAPDLASNHLAAVPQRGRPPVANGLQFGTLSRADKAPSRVSLDDEEELWSNVDDAIWNQVDDLELPVPNAVTSQLTVNEHDDARTQFADSALVSIAAVIPIRFRKVFKFGLLNRMQSSCFNTAFETSENMVISAPTGSGKTVVFELAMIRLLINEPESKVLYIAPTKSLCSERFEDWSKSFDEGLDVACALLTGDTSSNEELKAVKKAQILVSTPEKWDSSTRLKAISEKLNSIKLICIDEVHILNEDRGPTLEVIVSRMKTFSAGARFLAVSATCPNVSDVARWIGSNTGSDSASQHIFDDSYRPCPLKKFVYGYPLQGKNPFVFANLLNHKLLEHIKTHSDGKPTLIFCNTRKSSVQAAETLEKEYQRAASERKGSLPWLFPSRTLRFADTRLAELAKNGIAYHHAGMIPDDRKAVETAFSNGNIKVLCATSTLALGVNLPARLVIIRGTDSYDAVKGTRRYSASEILQMMGRAGRGSDAYGVAVILTSLDLKDQFENLLENRNLLESCLHKNLVEHFCSEITLETITSHGQAIQWLKTTFLWVRMETNPKHYGIVNLHHQRPETRLNEIVTESLSLDLLVADKLCEVDTNGVIRGSQFGFILSKYSLAYASFKAFVALESANLRTVIYALASSKEYEPLRLLPAEKAVYSGALKHHQIRFPLPKASFVADKIFALIQIILSGIPHAEIQQTMPSDVPALHLHSSAVFKELPRLAKSLFDIALVRKDALTCKSALEALRSIGAKTWEDSPFVLRQLTGIGEKAVKIFASKNICTISDLARLSAGKIESLLNRKSPFGIKIRDQVRSMPLLSVSIEIRKEDIRQDGIHVCLQVKLSIATQPMPVYPPRSCATLLVMTSDNLFIDFRRIAISTLVASGSKVAVLQAKLVKPSQNVLAFAASEKFAGMQAQASISPSTSREQYPTPVLAAENGEEQIDSDSGTSTGPKISEARLRQFKNLPSVRAMTQSASNGEYGLSPALSGQS